MRFGSVCSGIEAASVAWEPLGFRPAWFAEIEGFPAAVLKAHWPSVPNYGDFTRIGKDVSVEPVKLLVGGTPCQSFSVAGKRLGLADPRGNLTLEFLDLVGRLRPRWVVWENVPGVMSDDGGRTFGAVLGILGQLGYGVAYRVLDAQFFGVPQRRRRVFVVGHLGAWQRAAAVLFEPSCLRGDPAPRREAREGVAASLTHGVDSGGRGGYAGRRREDDVNLVPFETTQITSVANRSNPRAGDTGHPLASGAHAPAIAGTLGSGQGGWRSDTERMTFVPPVSPAIKARDSKGPSSYGDGDGAILVPTYALDLENFGVGGNIGWREEMGITLNTNGNVGVAHALRADGFDASEDGTGRGTPLVADPIGANEGRTYTHEGRNNFRLRNVVPAAFSVRRLTPRECERLQGFPDDFTAVTYKGKPAKDSPRYRALGNSMAVPVVCWIGRAILAAEVEMSP